MASRKLITDLLAAMMAAWLSLYFPLRGEDLSFEEVASTRLYDRRGVPLREILSAQQGRGHWTPLDSISPRIIEAAIVAEDKRFFDHHGVDAYALARAIWQNVQAGEVVSGGSTITQQVIRNVFHFRRNVLTKVLEMWYAVRLENTLTKHGILEQYFNRIPFGNQTFGVEAAAQMYLGKGAFELTWGEAAFLASLPKSPTYFNPYRDRGQALRRRALILTRLQQSGRMDFDDMTRALHEPLILFPKFSPFKAPHFSEWVLTRLNAPGDVRTSLDVELQEEVEKIVEGHLRTLTGENVTNAAVLVWHNPTGQILAMTGSADFFDTLHDGQFNAVFAKRQPGSALKPFTYALAFSRGYTAATLIPDLETIIPSGKGHFTPRNYDNTFHGPVRARVALACSYNVPAVRIVQDLGIASLLSKLRECGMASLSEEAEYYGHGLTLGNGEVSLFELVRAYSVLANAGVLMSESHAENDGGQVERRDVFGAEECWLVTDILADAVSRAPAFGYDSPLSLPFRCAVKTGTSSDFRDNWTVGYTEEFTVGVWAGNFDNKPMKSISGVTGAGPIFHDIMTYLYRDRVPAFRPVPTGLRRIAVCSLSGLIPNATCPHRVLEFFQSGREPVETCAVHSANGLDPTRLSPVYSSWWNRLPRKSGAHSERVPMPTGDALRIVYPLDKSRLKIDPAVGPSHQAIFLEAVMASAVRDVRWYLNGRELTGDDVNRVYWKLEKGTFRVTVRGTLAGRLVEDRIEFEVD